MGIEETILFQLRMLCYHGRGILLRYNCPAQESLESACLIPTFKSL